MKNKNKVPKSTKTKLSDLTPKKDARGGQAAPTPPYRPPSPTPPYQPPKKVT